MASKSRCITIQHIGANEGGQPLFTLSNGETITNPVSLPDPASVAVAGYESSPFPQHLRWYLEEYLNLPYGPSRKRAEAVADALKAWGTAVFDALFDRNTYYWYTSIRDSGSLEDLQIRIVSSSPAILSWPWEALCDSEGHFLIPHCCLERQPDPKLNHSPEIKQADRLRMLLVIARPYGEGDVGYHALARSLVDYAREKSLPVEIDVLRPPTFDGLRDALQKAKRDGKPYHIVHFDGHGGYGGRTAVTGGPQKFQGAEGCLVFETDPKPGEKIEPDPRGAGELGEVLLQCGVSMAVLNACQSAMVDKKAESAYASVAASLLSAGIPSVTAMGYSLYVSGAKHFVPAYYQELFQSGVPAKAMMAGRMAMFTHSERNTLLEKLPLWDWIVPELYQKVPTGQPVLPVLKQAPYRPEAGNVYPQDALEQDVGGFLGRGQAILELERLMRRKAAGILIHGMAGAGKTTLAKGFLAWLRDTGGLREPDGTLCPVIWFDFRDVSTGTYLVDHLAALLCKGGAAPQNQENRRRVVDLLKKRRAFLVWDNFESASGALGTGARLSEEERQYLKRFLEDLRDGRTKVLITSRTEENWLTGGTDRFCAHMKRDLEGLRGEELWDYCGQIAEELGLTLDRDRQVDTDLAKLLDKLDGNPLAVRSILLRLKDSSASDLLAELDRTFQGAAGDESTRRIQAAFGVLMEGGDQGMKPVLQVLSLHEHYADADIVEIILALMGQMELGTPERQGLSEAVARCFSLLERAGLCTCAGQTIYRLHPALRGCLAERYPPTGEAQHCFAVGMGVAEVHYHNDEEQRRLFCSLHQANLRHALEIVERRAETPELQTWDMRLTFALAAHAGDRGDYGQAEALYLQLADKAQRYGDLLEEDRAYRQLSALAFRQGDRDAEKRWAEKAADLWRNAENLTGDILLTLGVNAESQGDPKTARNYLEQAAERWEQEGDERVFNLYGALGSLAGQMDDPEAAEGWLRKSWEKAKERRDLSLMANSSVALGVFYEAQRNWKEAETYYGQSLEDFTLLRDDAQISNTRQMLGGLYVKMGRLGAAKEEFTQAANIAKRLNLKRQIANCYDGLGDVALLEGVFSEARGWYEEERKIGEELQNEDILAHSRRKLELLEAVKDGKLDGLQERLSQMLAKLDPEDLKKLLNDIQEGDK